MKEASEIILQKAAQLNSAQTAPQHRISLPGNVKSYKDFNASLENGVGQRSDAQIRGLRRGVSELSEMTEQDSGASSPCSPTNRGASSPQSSPTRDTDDASSPASPPNEGKDTNASPPLTPPTRGTDGARSPVSPTNRGKETPNSRRDRLLFQIPHASVWSQGKISDADLESCAHERTDVDWFMSERLRKKRSKLKPIQVENIGERPAILSFFAKDEQILLIPLECVRIEPGQTEMLWPKEKMASFRVVIKVPAVNQAHPWHEDALATVKMRRGYFYSLQVTEPDPQDGEVLDKVLSELNQSENPLHAAIQAFCGSFENNQLGLEVASDVGSDSRRMEWDKVTWGPTSLSVNQPERCTDSSDRDGSHEHDNSVLSSRTSERGDDDTRPATLYVSEVLSKSNETIPLVRSVNLGNTMPADIQLHLSDGTNLSVDTSKSNDGQLHEVLSRGDSSLVAEFTTAERLKLSAPYCAAQKHHLALMSHAFMVGSFLTVVLKGLFRVAPLMVCIVVLSVSLLVVFSSSLRNAFLQKISHVESEQACSEEYILELKSVPGVAKRPKSATSSPSKVGTGTLHTRKFSDPSIRTSRPAVNVTNFSGKWELDLEASDDPSPYLQALGASWLEQHLMRRVKRTIVIDHMDTEWMETITCSLITKKSEMLLDSTEQTETNPFDGSAVSLRSFIDEDGQCVVTKRAYSKRQCVQETRRHLLNEGTVYKISHRLEFPSGEVLLSSTFYNKVKQQCHDLSHDVTSS